jgi:hypothetical protein
MGLRKIFNTEEAARTALVMLLEQASVGRHLKSDVAQLGFASQHACGPDVASPAQTDSS